MARNLGRPFLGKKHQHVITEADSFSKNAVARSSTTSTTSSSAKKEVLITVDFNCSQLKSLLKYGFIFWGHHFLTPNFEEGIAIVWGGPYTNQDETLIL